MQHKKENSSKSQRTYNAKRSCSTDRGIVFIFQTYSSNISAEIPTGLTIIGPLAVLQIFQVCNILYNNTERQFGRHLLVIGFIRPVLLALIARRTFFFERQQTFESVFGWDHLGDNRVVSVER